MLICDLRVTWRYLRQTVSIGWFALFFIMVHIGQLIEQELRRQRRSVSWFARELYCDRTNVYKLFRKESIDTVLLYRISEILSYDFFRYYSNELSKESTGCGGFVYKV